MSETMRNSIIKAIIIALILAAAEAPTPITEPHTHYDRYRPIDLGRFLDVSVVTSASPVGSFVKTL